LRGVAVTGRVCPAAKAYVVCDGVNATTLFNPDLASTRPDVRRRLGIPAGVRVLGFVGRIVRDKGFPELWQAWRRVCSGDRSAHFLIVGEYEEKDAISPETARSINEDSRVHFVPAVPKSQMPEIYAAMDVLALPTYREGLPNVLLEAGAMRIPVVATRVTGCVDAVLDGDTGALVSAGDVGTLASAIEDLFADEARRRRFGLAARARMLQLFRPEKSWEELLEQYRAMLRTAAIPLPPFAASMPPHASGRSNGAAPRES
jgi:glycosyltransferase involved in cell wall biosynthesis